uniref:Uncharacterized protein n=1 Tax=Amphiprion percula TaxID=161767 RepID=A0A3P8SHN6_AMPPE
MAKIHLTLMHLLRLGLLAFSCLFWAAGLAIFTLGVWAQISLADYMLLSANRYPNAPLILLTTGAAITAWGFLGCLGVAANLPLNKPRTRFVTHDFLTSLRT